MSDLIRRAEEAQARRTDQEAEQAQKDRVKAQRKQERDRKKQQWERRWAEYQALRWVHKRLGVRATIDCWERYDTSGAGLYRFRLLLSLPDLPYRVEWYAPSGMKRKLRCLKLMCPVCSTSGKQYAAYEVKQLADLSLALSYFYDHRKHDKTHQQLEAA